MTQPLIKATALDTYPGPVKVVVTDINGNIVVTGALTVGGANVWTTASLTNLNQLTNGPGFAQLASANFTILQQGGSTVWTQANLTNLNQLTNGPGYLTGITSAQVTGALGYTPYNQTNPAGYISAAALGPYALLSGANFTSLQQGGSTVWTQANLTNNTQLSNGAGYLSSINSAQVTGALGYTPYNNTNPSGFITSASLAPYAVLASSPGFTGQVRGNGGAKGFGAITTTTSTATPTGGNPGDFVFQY